MDINAEVESLHAALAGWLGSASPVEVFEEFAAAQDPLFSMVTISGQVLARQELLDGLKAAGNSQPGLVIEIRDLTQIAYTDEFVVVRFLERHHRESSANDRLVTAVLSQAPQARHGLRWRAVHETAA